MRNKTNIIILFLVFLYFGIYMVVFLFERLTEQFKNDGTNELKSARVSLLKTFSPLN